MRLRVGLTGGIGSGKSDVAPGSPGLARIAATWPQAITAAGELDRPALAAIVFRNGAARDELNAIVHPEVRRLGAEREAAAAPDQIVVQDVPLLFEGGFYRECDANVLVVADRETRIGRIVARNGLEPEEVERRMKAQIDPDRARELADYVIPNDGTIAALRESAAAVYEELLERVPTASHRNPTAAAE
jgi:dephospho-CoA kinase